MQSTISSGRELISIAVVLYPSPRPVFMLPVSLALNVILRTTLKWKAASYFFRVRAQRTMNALPYRFSRRDRVYSLLKKVGQLESPDVLLSDHDLRASLRVFFAAKQSNGNVRILTDRPEIWRGIKGVDVKCKYTH